MKRVQQRSIEQGDCGVACVAMLAGCTYRQAFAAFGFAENQRDFYTEHRHLIGALKILGCAATLKKFSSWRKIPGHAIVAVNHTRKDYWHWVAFDGEAILDPHPDRLERKADLRGLHGRGMYVFIGAETTV